MGRRRGERREKRVVLLYNRIVSTSNADFSSLFLFDSPTSKKKRRGKKRKEEERRGKKRKEEERRGKKRKEEERRGKDRTMNR